MSGFITPTRVVPMVDNRIQFANLLKQPGNGLLMLDHCNVLELVLLCEQAQRKGYRLCANIDHISGVHADQAGIRYLVDTLHVVAIESTNIKVLALAKQARLTTIFHVYAADSTGLGSALEVVDPQIVDMLDISPALVIPHIRPPLARTLPLPFVGSGLISTTEQLQSIMEAGAAGVLLAQDDVVPSSVRA